MLWEICKSFYRSPDKQHLQLFLSTDVVTSFLLYPIQISRPQDFFCVIISNNNYFSECGKYTSSTDISSNIYTEISLERNSWSGWILSTLWQYYWTDIHTRNPGTDPLHNKGHGDLWPSQGTEHWKTQREQSTSRLSCTWTARW